MGEVNEVVEAINQYFSDKSRSPAETLEGLEQARDEIDGCIQALREDLESS